MESFSLLQLAVVKQDFLSIANLIVIYFSKIASLSVGFKNTNVELEKASSKPVNATEYVLCTEFLLLSNFVPQEESFEKIKVYSLFNKSKLSWNRTITNMIYKNKTR